MTSCSFFKYFDVFELDVNIVNFVYYVKTRKKREVGEEATGKMKTATLTGSG